MKKLMKLFVLVAAAAIALASCQKNEFDAPIKKEVHFTINAGISQTKTIITDNGNGTYTPSWDGNESLAVLFTLPNKDTEDSHAKSFANQNAAGDKARFTATVSDVSESGTLYAIHPYSAFGRGFDGGIARLDLSSEQKPTANSFDPLCDIMVAKPYNYIVEEDDVVVDPLYFTRVMSVLRVNLKSKFADIQNETVESIKFSTGGVNITGYAKISVQNPEFTGEWTTKYDYVTATYEDELVSVNGTDNSVYFVIAPVTIPTENTLTFTIKTTNYTITKIVTEHPEMKFSAGNVAVIDLNIKEDECTSRSGEVSAQPLPFETDFSDKKESNVGLTELEGFTVSGSVYNASGAIRLAKGDASGTITTESIDLSDKFHVVVYAAGWDEDELVMNVSSGGQTSELSLSTYGTNSFVPYVVNFEPVSANATVSFTAASGKRVFIQKIQVKAGHGVAPSVLTAVTPEIMSADGGAGSFAYTLTNPKEGVQLVPSVDVDWITGIGAADGIVNYTVGANDNEESRNATITITYGDISTSVSITQAGKPAEGAPTTVTDKLVASLFAATSTSYTNFSGVSVTSPAVYAGNSAKTSSGGIQLRSNNSTSGIVTTTSGGKAKTITVTWASGNTSGRTLDIYGKSTAYSAASDLYNSNNQGTKLGSIVEGTSTKLEITGDYEFIGLRSKSGAMYLTSIEITWETNAGSGSGGTTDPETPGEGGGNEGGETPDPTPDPEPEPDPDPTPDPDQPGVGGSSTINVTFSSHTAGTQYANNEKHEINDVLTLYTTECHFTSELRIYSSSTHDGYVVSNQLPGAITNLSFNAGNKVDVLNVYGSTDGSTWELVEAVSITSTSYKDYSVDFTGSYTYFKLDVAGANQVRLKSLSVTYQN